MTKPDNPFIDSTSVKDHELETVLKYFGLSTSEENKEKLKKDLKLFRNGKGANIKRDEFYKHFETIKHNYAKPKLKQSNTNELNPNNKPKVNKS